MSMIEATAIEKRIADRLDPTIAGGLEVSRHAGGLAFNNVGEAMEFSKMMAVSQIGIRKHLRGNVGACLAITVQAIEWGMSPFAVANKSYLVNDQIAYESQLVQAVILRRAPIKGRFKFSYDGEGDKRKCTVTATLTDGDLVEYESPEIGKIPVKNSPLWKNDPDQQLSYYAGRALCRRYFPEVLLGIYDIDEMPETPRDPERARDVTAPRTLEGRLAALADTPRDAATGEIIDAGPTAEAGANETDAGSSPPSQAAGEEAAAESASDTPAADNPLLDKAREKALQGRKKFNLWFGGLSVADADSLGPHLKSLLAAADATDGKSQ